MDRLFAVSEHGHRYVAERYPWFADRCEVARLGVPEMDFLTPGSIGSAATIVSCSGIVPVKRVDLILRAIDAAARSRPDISFEWHHFGDGESRTRLETRARASLPANAKAVFHGQVSVRQVMDFYASHPVDAFVNASESEGGSPVAIMEAASCGIPIVATSVGGNPEIVSDRNGVLTSPDPSPEELGRALLMLVNPESEHSSRRIASRRVWEDDFQASINYKAFADRLRNLPEESQTPNGRHP